MRRGASRAASNWVHTLGKRTTEDVELIVEELLQSDLTKAERIKRLRQLAQSGGEVPDELMDRALRRLMERITD